MFIDYVKIFVKAGDGGNGAVAFRHEKFVPKGGPAGGNGGRGGDIVFLADRNLHTLLDLRYKRRYVAKDGDNGGTSLKDGRSGSDVIVKVPVGTLIKSGETERILCDLDEDGIQFIAAKGGKGGKGNANFATPTNQAPRFAEEGKPGEEGNIILELKLIADVGLVGFPNAGKSTFISTVSAARPKIADYPFTTLEPNLGIVKYKDFRSFTVADIPGIIEGAHIGKGLGIKFLRHIERTKLLMLMIDISSADIQKEYDTLVNELNNYSKELTRKERFVVLTKADLLLEEKIEKIKKKKIKGYKGLIFILSSVSGYGVQQILDYLWQQLKD
ncbi:MAG: GTPase ObgE [Ignavibacteria bacterium RBG_13_36_8]|nr:MAG: GTPase ObgE [Ignavibacteria bacterium RBG_13_36_8]